MITLDTSPEKKNREKSWTFLIYSGWKMRAFNYRNQFNIQMKYLYKKIGLINNMLTVLLTL